jgi:hypothetical protein
MAAVLTTSSNITCSHSGGITPDGASKLKINGSPVVLKAGVAGKSVGPPPCSVVTDPNTGTKQCLTVAAVSGGEASKLKVNGQPVLLETLSGTTDGTGPKPPDPPPALPNGIKATANQTKLTAS